MQLSNYFKNLTKDNNGIYTLPSIVNPSYPEGGNEASSLLEDHSFWFRHRLDCILALFKNFPPSGPTLDVGGGNGYVTLGLQQAGFEALLLEPGYEGITNARARGVENAVHGTFEDDNIINESLDGVALFDVLEHVKEDKALLSLIHKKLKAKGRIYLTVPAYQFLWSTEDEYAGHFRRYSREEISNLLESAGFKVEFSSYIFSWLVSAVYFLKSIPYHLKIKKKVGDGARYGKEHLTSSTILKNGTLLSLAFEKMALQRKISIPFGTSCIVVAQKS